jgi:hypothetical protein
VLVVFVTVALNARLPVPASRLAVLGDTDTSTGELMASDFGQAAGPVLAGAVVVAAVGETTTLAVSDRCGIESSNTVRVTVNEPLVGAVTAVLGALTLDTG